jgi:hypothetical protein
LNERIAAMPVRTQLMNRGTARVDAHAELQCANCGWFTILDATDSAGSFRGTCHRYDYLSTEKTPLVHADDWCFDHRPNRDLDCATQEDLQLSPSSH